MNNGIPANCKLFKIILIRTATLLVMLSGMIWLWDGVIQDQIIPKRWGIVQEGLLYRSGRLSASLVRSTLEAHKIAIIIDLTSEKPDNRDQLAEKSAAAALGIELLRFPLRGNGTGDIEHYAKAIATMVQGRREQKPVLVHCAAGAQRTGGIIACYRMLVEGKPPVAAYNELKQYGWNPDKDQDLPLYVNQHIGELAYRLQRMGVIEKPPNPLPQLPTNR